MANGSTLTLFLGNIGGQLGGIDGAINASVSANTGDGAGTISGTITAIGNAAGMFPGALGAYGGFAVTMSNLAKTGFDGSKLTIGDALTIGASVAALVGAPLIGFGLTVAGLGWTVYTLSDPSKNLTLPDLFNQAKAWAWPSDPIILDLDGDGLETVGLAANIYFDHDGDGVLTRTGWAGAKEGLLVWDSNANDMLIGSTGWNWIYENGSYRVEHNTTPQVYANVQAILFAGSEETGESRSLWDGKCANEEWRVAA